MAWKTGLCSYIALMTNPLKRRVSSRAALRRRGDPESQQELIEAVTLDCFGAKLLAMTHFFSIGYKKNGLRTKPTQKLFCHPEIILMRRSALAIQGKQ